MSHHLSSDSLCRNSALLGTTERDVIRDKTNLLFVCIIINLWNEIDELFLCDSSWSEESVEGQHEGQVEWFRKKCPNERVLLRRENVSELLQWTQTRCQCTKLNTMRHWHFGESVSLIGWNQADICSPDAQARSLRLLTDLLLKTASFVQIAPYIQHLARYLTTVPVCVCSPDVFNLCLAQLLLALDFWGSISWFQQILS